MPNHNLNSTTSILILIHPQPITTDPHDNDLALLTDGIGVQDPMIPLGHMADVNERSQLGVMTKAIRAITITHDA